MDVFNILNSFYIANNLEWITLISVSTDGVTSSMLGITSGLIKLIKDKSPVVISIYYFNS